ncbi:MAG: hypothetical protein LC746_08645 [Acidobacteria bacterium]|nr:hypothetical protein [Acidobacteriota bacterium]
MALINLQAALYFQPKPANADLLARVGAAIPALNERLRINLRALDDTAARILGGAEELFEESGNQFFLLYDEEKCFYGTNEWTLYVSFLDDYENATAVHVNPELPEPTEELTGFVWSRLLGIVKELIIQTEPSVAQINGLDEEEGGQIVSPRTLRAGALPEFFTPYTYLDQSLLDPSAARKIEDAGAYSVERLASGWSIQFVENFNVEPPSRLIKTLRELNKARKPVYKQTPMTDD